jgi:formylglycine-generating enzyme required for sulfatase activity
MTSPFRILLIGLALAASAVAQLQPLVSNIQASQRPGTKLVDISYAVAYGGGPVTIWIEVSNDGGRSFIVPAKTFSGHIGQNVQPGTNRTVVWNAEADFDGMLAEQMRVRVNARAGNVPIPPQHMVYIPGGHFYMGPWDSGNAASSRSVYVSPFFMDRYEVWQTLFMEITLWSSTNGYDSGGGGPGNHPQVLDWYSVVKWCNARSEREGLTPVYYTDTSHSTVYRSGSVDLTNAMVKWDANGYRLPTEAEWEKAARGGLSGKQFPWGDIIQPDFAVYERQSALEVGSKNSPNGFGLFDVAGNVWEWCWDRFADGVSGLYDPVGPDNGASRVLRGGGWQDHSSTL